MTKVSMMSYSIDMMKKSAFQDELTNVLNIASVDTIRDEEWLYVYEYFTRRIKEIEQSYK
jgi:hypothetical protein